ncbi:MAG: hypothetical protein Q3990_07165 [Desulfovibrionaceae bacterium]|nr:hypothetical protein [Desulfovibrionaceae bacterium]
MTIQDNVVTASASIPEAGFEGVMRATALIFLISQNEVFADILNAVLFNGRHVVDASEVQDYRSQFHYLEREGLPDVRRDVVKLWHGAIIRVVGISMDDHVEPDLQLPQSLQQLELAEYDYQVQSCGKERYPVVTLALYFGEDKPWDGPLSLEIEDVLRPYTNDYKVNLFQIPWLSREQADLFKSDFRFVADYYVKKREGSDYKVTPADFAHRAGLLSIMKAITKDERFGGIL